jgi:hypothetical protein
MIQAGVPLVADRERFMIGGLAEAASTQPSSSGIFQTCRQGR